MLTGSTFAVLLIGVLGSLGGAEFQATATRIHDMLFEEEVEEGAAP